MDRAWQNWKLTLAYDGSDFQGWQVQPECATVQGTLADALERVTGERVLPQGSGRTDTGVHAEGQVASCQLLSAIPAENLQRALNRILPVSIRVMRVEPVDANFHARHSTRRKTYEYRVYRGAICPPTLARYVHAMPWSLDVTAMNAAAQFIVGEHDFTSFAATEGDVATRNRQLPPEQRNFARRIYSSSWEERDCKLLVYRVEGSGFLHHMVRNLVGTFLDVGRGRRSAASIPDILAARDRSAAGPTAPPTGLFLVNVVYEDSAP
jgi:tRNA pseudouridine38-40 synthase